jgi:hypothetical protein
MGYIYGHPVSGFNNAQVPAGCWLLEVLLSRCAAPAPRGAVGRWGVRRKNDESDVSYTFAAAQSPKKSDC